MTAPEGSNTADPVRLALLLPVLFGGLALVGLSRPLAPAEASFLLDCGGSEPAGDLALGWGRAWAAIAGLQDTSARGASMLLALIATACVGFTAARRGAGAVFAAILVMMATPAFWLHGTGIGASAPVMAAVALLAAALAAACRLGPTAAGRFALAAAIAAPFALPASAQREAPQELARLGCGYAGFLAESTPWMISAAVTVIAVLFVRLGADRAGALLDLTLLAAAVGAPTAAAALGLGREDPFLLTAALPGAALVLAGPASLRAGAPTLVLLAMCVFTFAAVHDETRAPESPDPRSSLDWMREHVDARAWALTLGADRDVYAYRESTGHRTGHLWYTPDSPEDLARLVEAAATRKAPVIALLGKDDAVLAAFAKYYDVVPVAGAPTDVTILGWRTG